MFSVDCPRHGRAVLLSDDHIERIRSGTDGIRMQWRCSCGARGETRTGRPRPAAVQV